MSNSMLGRISEEKKRAENMVGQVSYKEILHDISNFQSHFNKKDFLSGAVFGLGNI